MWGCCFIFLMKWMGRNWNPDSNIQPCFPTWEGELFRTYFQPSQWLFFSPSKYCEQKNVLPSCRSTFLMKCAENWNSSPFHMLNEHIWEPFFIPWRTSSILWRIEVPPTVWKVWTWDFETYVHKSPMSRNRRIIAIFSGQWIELSQFKHTNTYIEA